MLLGPTRTAATDLDWPQLPPQGTQPHPVGFVQRPGRHSRKYRRSRQVENSPPSPVPGTGARLPGRVDVKGRGNCLGVTLRRPRAAADPMDAVDGLTLRRRRALLIEELTADPRLPGRIRGGLRRIWRYRR